jgi:anti-anti-sigma factor
VTRRSQISVRYSGEVAIFDVSGYLTEDSEEALISAYQQERVQNSPKILMNFDEESFITSSGFGLIVKLLWKLREKEQVLRVAHPSHQVRRIFNTIGLTRNMKGPESARTTEIFESEGDALIGF